MRRLNPDEAELWSRVAATIRPLSSPSTAAFATAADSIHITEGSAFSASSLVKPARSPKPVSTGPGQRAVAVTPLPLSSPTRDCV